MQNLTVTTALSESEFAVMVDTLAEAPASRELLLDMLREDHPHYNQRGAAAIVRMRGWIWLALARAPLPEPALLYVLEELETGLDPYLMAAAARALRAYPHPHESFAPFVLRGITNIRNHDEPISFEQYGAYAESEIGTSPLRELLETLIWLGPCAHAIKSDIAALRTNPDGLPSKWWPDIDRALQALREGIARPASATQTCCKWPDGFRQILRWSPDRQQQNDAMRSVIFEDQAGKSVTFPEFFFGQPSIVVFFYTRCDNPLKCSLTITKLAHVQKLLTVKGLGQQIRTAAITYDPAFDLPERLRVYGQDRGVSMSSQHRLLRVRQGEYAVQQYFKLGVNFIESLVNRHRIEVYVLDAEGRIAVSFERLHWEEDQVVARACEILRESVSPLSSAMLLPQRKATTPMFGPLAALAVAFFPKCPICWAGYLSMFGIAGLERIPYSPWLLPILVILLLVNLGSAWVQGHATKHWEGFALVTAGSFCLCVLKLGFGWSMGAPLGVGLTILGSFLTVLRSRKHSLLMRSSSDSVMELPASQNSRLSN